MNYFCSMLLTSILYLEALKRLKIITLMCKQGILNRLENMLYLLGHFEDLYVYVWELHTSNDPHQIKLSNYHCRPSIGLINMFLLHGLETLMLLLLSFPSHILAFIFIPKTSSKHQIIPLVPSNPQKISKHFMW